MRKAFDTAADLLRASPRFEVRARLGKGGYGEVFEAFDRERGARVAVKLLRRTDPQELYRFKQEFRALAELNHPNLVRLYDLVIDDRLSLFTMEIVDGPDAIDYIRHDGRHVDERRLRSVLLQLAEGISAMHAAGRLHRDIKPSNVLVGRDGRLVIVDLGLTARMSRSGEMSRADVVGTPAYLAPELVHGSAATEPSDWYAVGVLLYEALTGRVPFGGALDTVLMQKLARDPPRPSALGVDVPADLDELAMALLHRKPEGRPTGDEIIEQLGGSADPRSGVRRDTFVGRARERALAGDLFRLVTAEQRAAVALVAGPSGMGKSALLDQIAADIRRAAPDAVILSGRCYVQESVPYKALDALVDPLSRHLTHLPAKEVRALLPDGVRALSRLFPVLDRVPSIAEMPARRLADAVELRRQAIVALRALFTAIARSRPLALLIDDFQWGDRESGVAIAEILAAPAPPILFVAAYRDDEAEASACIEAARPAFHDPSLVLTQIALGELGEKEARDLCAALLPASRALTTNFIQSITREAGGRPFFIRELVALAQEGTREVETVSVDALVRARASALPEGARALLEVIAVAGRPVDRAAAAEAAGLGEEEPAATHALHAARLARRRAAYGRDEVEAYHDRVREAVAAGLTPERRTAHLRRLAIALDQPERRADAETLSVYYLEGGDPARAAELAVIAAGEAARALAFDRAARLYQRALDLSPVAGERRSELLEALGDALGNAGRSAEAAPVLREAAAGAERDRAFELCRRATEQLLCAGRVEAGMAGLHEQLAAVGLAFPRRRWQVMLGLLVWVTWLWLRGFRIRARPPEEIPPAVLRRADTAATAARSLADIDPLLAAYFSARTTAAALASGDRARAFEAVSAFGGFVTLMGAGAGSFAARAIRAMDELGAGVDPVRAEGATLFMTGIHLSLAGDRVRALQMLDSAGVLLRERYAGDRWAINLTVELGFQSMLWSGAWKDAAARLPLAVAEARARGNHQVERSIVLRAGHLDGLLGDDPEAAQRGLERAHVGSWRGDLTAHGHLFGLARGDIALYAEHGRGPTAHRFVETEIHPALARSRIRRMAVIRTYQTNLRARAAIACAAGDVSEADRARALAVADRAATDLARIANPLAQGLAALARAGIAAFHGRREEAIIACRDAERQLAEVSCRHYIAASKRRRGELSGDAALIEEADAWLRGEGAKNPARLAAMLLPGRW